MKSLVLRPMLIGALFAGALGGAVGSWLRPELAETQAGRTLVITPDWGPPAYQVSDAPLPAWAQY